MGENQQSVIPQRNGTTQQNRLSKKLLPEFVPIDERQVSDFLAYIAEYAELIPFYDEHHEKVGNWKPFFTKDISVFLASIVSMDLEGVNDAFEHKVQLIQNTFNQAEKQNHFGEMLQFILDIATRFNDWMGHIMTINRTGGDFEANVELELYKLINQQLASPLTKVYAFAVGAKELKIISKLPEFDTESLYGAWKFTKAKKGGALYRGLSSGEKLSNALIELRILYRSFFNGLEYLVARFRDLFQRSIDEKNDHKPDIGLFITFLHLFRHLQDDINTLSERHLDFYFREILEQQNREAIPDEVNLILEPARTTSSYRLEEGARFSAGLDENGKEIIFESLGSTEINKTQIQSIRSVFVSRILENQVGTYKLVTGLYASPVANSRDGRGAAFDHPGEDWPLFGEEQYKSGLDTMEDATVGFALESPLFFLAEGNRRVKIHIDFKESTTEIFKKLIEDLADEPSDAGYRDAFYEVFGREKNAGFRVLVSTEEGWVDMANEEASNQIFIDSPKPWRFNGLTIGFTIPASSPPVVPMSRPGENFRMRYPMVKFLMNPSRSPYLYSFLENMEMSQVKIEVEVDKVRDMVLYNDLGRLDASQPFQAFGPTPGLGSYMLVGNSEIFKKPLSNLRFEVEWKNLPHGGLEKYYEGYFDSGKAKITEETIKVRMSALSGNEFKPEGGEKELVFPLFDEQGLVTSSFQIKDLEKLNIRHDADLGEVVYYDNNTEVGFFKFEMIWPREGFGNGIFQDRFAEVVQNNASLDEDVEKKKVPNPPFIPVAKTITLTYKAEETITLEKADPKSRLTVYHITPFGAGEVFSGADLKMEKPLLIPVFDHDAYCYLGLKDLNPPQDLSLLFQLVAGETKRARTFQMPDLEWSFLSDNEWIPLQSINLLGDTTDGFTTTGIVKLHIPGKITRNNSVMPSGMHWIRVSLVGNTENVCRATDVYSQAITAQWVNNGESERLRSPLPAGAIRGLKRKIPQIKTVTQPYPSFNGQPTETDHEFYRRISERLRHKSRAVNIWDYERLVLGKFHTIHQVKCMTYLTDPQYIPPGEVRVVVVPGVNHSTQALTPKVNYKALANITSVLKSSASPFINLRVDNPTYEYVRVNCKVKFIEGHNNGHSLERLKKDLERFMCPWLDGNRTEFNIGGSIKVDSILNFMKELEYVKFITAFQVLHFYVGNEEVGEWSYHTTADPGLEKELKEEVQATKPWSVLVPDMDHQFEIIQQEIPEAPEFSRRPVSFQSRIQITQSHIRILKKKKEIRKYNSAGYQQSDTLKIFV